LVPLAADLDGDSDLDLAAAVFFPKHVAVVFNEGQDRFSSASFYPLPEGPEFLLALDLDGDGDVDLATANGGVWPERGTTVSILLNQGDGTFDPAANYTVGDFPSSLAGGDLNGDGKVDLVATVNGEEISVLLNRGGGAFADPVNWKVGPNPNYIQLVD